VTVGGPTIGRGPSGSGMRDSFKLLIALRVALIFNIVVILERVKIHSVFFKSMHTAKSYTLCTGTIRMNRKWQHAGRY
jgi:hypothetical protein